MKENKVAMLRSMAIVSVTDKTKLEVVCRDIIRAGHVIVASSGSATYLQEHEMNVRTVEECWKLKPLLGGRVKTLTSELYAGILADRTNKKHCLELKRAGIVPVDFVVVNLYDFASAFRDCNEIWDDALIDKIDVGGVSLLRAAMKNFQDVVSISSPEDYDEVCRELQCDGFVSKKLKRNLAVRTARRIANYDKMISDAMEKNLQTMKF